MTTVTNRAPAEESPATTHPVLRPRTATARGSLLRAEVGRLVRRRMLRLLAVLAALGLLLAMGVLFATHNTDVAAAHAQAQRIAAEQNAGAEAARQECLRNAPPADATTMCAPEMFAPPVDAFYSDPRVFADQALPTAAIAAGVVGALLAALAGATAVGADWSSRAVLTLLAWEPRRGRLLAARWSAIALVVAAAGVVGQALTLGLTALVVRLRGTFAATPPADRNGNAPAGQAVLHHAHFWRDMVSLEARTIGLMVIAALLAAAIAMLTRGTGGALGAAFGYFAVVEIGVNAVLGQVAGRWTLTQNIGAYLSPGGLHLAGHIVRHRDGSRQLTMVLVSNLDALAYLGAAVAVTTLAALVSLRRRDL